jgi:hypothetical protein
MAKVVGAVSDTLGEAIGVLSAFVAVATGGKLASGLVVARGSGSAGLA